MTWVFGVKESCISENCLNVIYPKGVSILIIKKEGKIYGVRNRCAHMSCTLGGGRLDGFTLACPCHDWRFDVRTGQFIDAPEIQLQTYELRKQGDDIMVNLTEADR